LEDGGNPHCEFDQDAYNAKLEEGMDMDIMRRASRKHSFMVIANMSKG
jgi:hypothetical protein